MLIHGRLYDLVQLTNPMKLPKKQQADSILQVTLEQGA